MPSLTVFDCAVMSSVISDIMKPKRALRVRGRAIDIWGAGVRVYKWSDQASARELGTRSGLHMHMHARAPRRRSGKETRYGAMSPIIHVIRSWNAESESRDPIRIPLCGENHF